MPPVAIVINDVAKKFGRQWLFKNINQQLHPNQTYALTGHNGSGKSTLLQIIYGYQTPTNGSIVYTINNQVLSVNAFAQQCAFVAPYLELPEELTLLEQLTFHFSFKPIVGVDTIENLIAEIGLQASTHKKIKHFSSGMKQRVKLAQAFYSQSQVWLFDEPCTNLDETGIEWYRNRMMKNKASKLILVASNQKHEYDFADTVIAIPPVKTNN